MKTRLKRGFEFTIEPEFQSEAELEETLKSLLVKLEKVKNIPKKTKYPPRKIRKKTAKRKPEKIEILELPFTF